MYQSQYKEIGSILLKMKTEYFSEINSTVCFPQGTPLKRNTTKKG